MKRTLVVFIHGFISSPKIWDSLLLECRADANLSELADFDTFDYSRSTGLFETPHSAMLLANVFPDAIKSRLAKSITSLANSLRTQLNNRWQTYEDIVLVGHSTGGLIARQYIIDAVALDNSGQERCRVSKLAMLSVPNEGTELANIAKVIFDQNAQVRQLCRKSDFLDSLNRAWSANGINDRLRIRVLIAGHDEVVTAESAAGKWDLKDIEEIEGVSHNQIHTVTSDKRDAFLSLRRLILQPAKNAQLKDGPIHADMASAQSTALKAGQRIELPASSSSFIGRIEELESLRDLLLGNRPQRLVTILAAGGYGKSRLALELARLVYGDYADGVCYAQLQGLRDSRFLAEELAGQLQIPPANAAAKERLLDWLKGRKTLLVCDGFEHLLDASGLIRELLEDPGTAQLQILLTSQTSLAILGEKLFPLGGLAEAEELFIERAQMIDPDFSQGARHASIIKGLCAELQAVPLAIEQAAAWVDRISPSEMLTELKGIMARSDAAGSGGQHSSVRAGNDWSWSLLTEAHRRALMQLSVCEGGFFADAAAELLGLGRLDALEVLGELIRRSWIREYDIELSAESSRKRFQFVNSTLGSYAEAKLVEAGGILASSTAAAHAQHFSKLAVRLSREFASQGQYQSMLLTGLERANLESALRYGLEQQDSQIFSVCELWLLPYLIRIGDYAPAIELSNVCLSKKRELDDELGAALTCSNLGAVHQLLGNYDSALEIYLECLPHLKKHDKLKPCAVVLGNIAAIHEKLQDYDKALVLYEECLTAYRGIHDELGIATVQGNMGIIFDGQGKHQQAIDLYSESLAAKQRLGNEIGAAETLGNMAISYDALGQHETARRLYQESLEAKLRLGSEHGAADTLYSMGLLFQKLGKLEEARSCANEAFTKYSEMGLKEASSIAQSLMKQIDAASVSGPS